MNKILYVTALTFIVLAICVALFGFFESRSRKITKKIISSIDFECPVGSVERIDQWGISGYKRYCLDDNQLNGPWIAFENKIVAVKGTYVKGREIGLWIWYTRDGDIFKTVEYENGEKKSEKIYTEYKW